jgi:nucleotide-binding universal stress UspA family protein
MNAARSNHFEIEKVVRPTRILVATDFTDREKLVPHVIAQAQATGADVILVHAITPEPPPFTEGGGFFFPAEPRDDRFDGDLLAEMAEQIEAQGVKCTTVLKHGYPRGIIQAAIDEKSGLRLIMGSHGRGKLAQFALGSVAGQLLGRVEIPLFIVGPHCAGCSDQARPKRILHPVSMNGEYRRGVEIAMELARMYGAEVTMLHVTDRETERAMNEGLALSWAEKIFDDLNPEEGKTRPSVKVSVAFGERVQHICGQATSLKTDWIVMGVDEGHDFWPLMETTAYRTLAAVNCPVFIFRHQSAFQEATEKKQEMASVNCRSLAFSSQQPQQ